MHFYSYLHSHLFLHFYIFICVVGCRPAHRLRMQMVRYNLGLGLFTALTLGWLESRQRLTGLQENEREVVRYGCLTEQELKDWHKRADKQNVYLINSSSYEYEKRAQEKA